MTIHTRLRARVSPEAISKVTRLFNGTLDDIFNELLQNARRAGATGVAVTAEHLDDACLITFIDDGAGIADPADLVSLGQSDWPDECRRREDPAGMGFFSLAGLDTVVSSASAAGSFSLAIAGDAWTGEADIDVLPWHGPMGTSISFGAPPQRDGKLQRVLEAAARHYPLPVTLDGAMLPSLDFLAGAHAITEREGYRIGLYRDNYSAHRDTINFHGLTLRHALSVIKEVRHTQWSVAVDIIDAPGLVLVLPARKEIFRNAALEALTDLCRQAIFEAIAREPFHRLSHDDWELARTFDTAFPEAASELPPWRPVTACDGAREVPRFTPIAPRAAIYDDGDSFDSVTFCRAIAFPQGDGDGGDRDINCLEGPEPRTFYAPITGFAGYSWYDALACYTRTGEKFLQQDGSETPCEADPATFRPDAITLELADQHGASLHLPTDLAIIDGENCWSNPDEVTIALTRGSNLDPGDLTDLIIDAAFCPSEDSDADSYDTQETRFRYDAAVRAHAILEGEDAAILAGIRMVFGDRIAWRIPKGRELRLTWSDKSASLELCGDQGEGPAQ